MSQEHSGIIAKERMQASGLATPLPAMSGDLISRHFERQSIGKATVDARPRQYSAIFLIGSKVCLGS
jgi:hypothetical protein